MAIIKLTENQRLIRMYEQLSAHMQIVRFRFARQSKKKLPWRDEDHGKLMNALKEQSREKATDAMTNHLLRARDAFWRERQKP